MWRFFCALLTSWIDVEIPLGTGNGQVDDCFFEWKFEFLEHDVGSVGILVAK